MAPVHRAKTETEIAHLVVISPRWCSKPTSVAGAGVVVVVVVTLQLMSAYAVMNSDKAYHGRTVVGDGESKKTRRV